MKYLLDTCLVSELVKKKPNPAVVSWLDEQDEQKLFLSVLNLGELQKGISK
ncbi:MAG: VapC toxin family PIN domain ribonuclease, partial [Deltaproteobacteria bacterium]|nr:VapC toxin family PIN domain ribonuclease [Deltaproteobacteria bacterium]